MPLALALTLLSPPMAALQPAAQSALIRDIASVSFTLVVKADGTVVGWGPDTDGQAARPRSAGGAINAPVTIDLPGKALQVAIGETTAYALLDDGTGEKGTIVAWGPNDEGQLGNGPMGATGELGRYPKPSETPVRVTGLTDIIQIEAGAKHGLALRKDGTVWAWGTRDDGALGDGRPKTLRPVMAIGPTQVPGLQGITKISSGRRHNLALRSDGRVMSWGLNHDGQLGNGTRDIGWSPAEVSGLDRVVAIATGMGSAGGNSFSGAVRDDGTVWLWGTATSGVMGDGNQPDAPDGPGGRILVPQQLKALTNVKALSLGYGHAAALLRDGSLRMWGFNGYGQIGVPSPDSSYHPKPVKVTGISNVAAVHVGSMRSFAVRTDGSLWIWGFASVRGQGILGKNLRVPTLLELP